jgi:hypothetical protein
LNTLQVHYSRFLYGTNVSAPSIVSQPGARTAIAGTAPLLKVQVAGTLPITYQWTANDVAIAGANTTTLKAVIDPVSSDTVVNYVLYATNDIGWAKSDPIAITFLAPPSPYAAAVAAAHPIAYWRLDEGSGTTMIDSAGYHDGTYSANVGFGATSVITTETNAAVSFRGVTSSFASVNNYPELNPRGPFSIEAWTRPNPGGANQGGVIVASQNRSSSRGGYVLHADWFVAEYGADLGIAGASVNRYQSSVLPQDGAPAHIVFAWDGVSPQGTLYVNGQVTATSGGGFANSMATFENNILQPLTIGYRYDNQAPWNGVVDEVAFYDYALSGAQVTNHWSFSWLASAITQQPVGVTNTEWSTITLSVAASGYPNTYQWYRVPRLSMAQ